MPNLSRPAVLPRLAWIVAALATALVPPALAQPFTSVASPAIAAHVSFSTGATWVDADHDGDLDLFVVTGFSANNNNVFYRNDGNDTFVNVTGVPLVEDAADSPCSTWGDYDNDGDLDAFVSNFAGPSILYDGQGGGALALNTTAGIGTPGVQGTGCAWGDYDNDSHLDVVVAVFGTNRLFRNNGNGTFAAVSAPGVTTAEGNHHHPTWSDYDGDGDLDLFFATGPGNSTGVDQMYRNMKTETGTATFTEITTAPFATEARNSQVISWVDYDNDGDLDMYAANYSFVPNQLYRNDGATFTKITTGAIVTDAGAAHSVTWGDFDNDGDQDVYVPRDLSQSNRYYRNEANGTFTSVTTGTFVNEGRSNYGATAGDYDGDGDLDLFLPTAHSQAASMLFRNDLAAGNHWLVVRLRGTHSNRSGIGAKVRVLATIDGAPRWQMREVLAGTGYGGPNALEAHFGLGSTMLADSIRVDWPSGHVSAFAGHGVDQIVYMNEDLPPTTIDHVPGPTSVDLTCAPSPFHAATTVEYRLAREQAITLAVYDTGGRLVAVLAQGVAGPGVHAAPISARALPRAGVYLVRLVSGEGELTRRIVHLR